MLSYPGNILRRLRLRGGSAATLAASKIEAVATSGAASVSSESRSGRSGRSPRGCRASLRLRSSVRPRRLRKNDEDFLD